jgi:metal-sulfur cluster biosynthetic enzyme/molybdopterin converting factor small subunit
MVTVFVPTPLRKLTNGQSKVEVAGRSVREVLANLEANYPGFADRVMENGKVKRFINVFVDGQEIGTLDGLDTAVGENAEVSIIPAMAGGETTSSTNGEQKTWTPEQEQIREALRVVVDPEIGMDVVTLGLVRDIVFHADETEVQMIMTTPFCPYAGMLIQQVKQVTAVAVDGPARVTLLDEPMWEPSMMEGGDIFSEWGLTY